VSYLLSNVKSSRREFNSSLHISKERLRLVPGNWPLFVGLSHGDGVVACVIGQTYNSEIRIFAAFVSEEMSLRHHLSECTRSWLSANARQSTEGQQSPRLLGACEDVPNADLKTETFQAAREIRR